MSTSGDAAEQVVRITLDGVQSVAKITGQGALEFAKLLLGEIQSPEKTRGRASLRTMLKSKKPIKVFEIDDKSLEKFCKEARKYGVMYHVLKDKNKHDGKCDIMIRAEDVSKVNRIYERFNLGISHKATIKSNIVKTKNETKQVPEKTHPEKSEEDKFIDELFRKPNQKEKTENENPSQAKTVESRPSAPSSGNRQNRSNTRDTQSERPSVKKQLEEIKRKQQSEKSSTTERQKTPIKNNKPKRRNEHGRT